MSRLRLGVNIDHVATIRNARGGDHPDPVRAAEIVAAVGGDGITAHLREDRRHIRDEDLRRIQAATDLPLNLEMAATEEMLAIALAHMPHAACIVPEKREERTTEGGLDIVGGRAHLAPRIRALDVLNRFPVAWKRDGPLHSIEVHRSKMASYAAQPSNRGKTARALEAEVKDALLTALQGCSDCEILPPPRGTAFFYIVRMLSPLRA